VSRKDPKILNGMI